VTVQIVEQNVEVPEEVNLTLDGHKVAVTGTNGELNYDFGHAGLNMVFQENTLGVWAENPRRRKAALVKTIASHVTNMIKGVTVGFTYRLKIVFIHFPLTINIQRDKVVINNFIGERAPRVARIRGNVQIKVEGDDIIVTGNDINSVAQTAANIQESTKIKNKDLRKFLDGIYVYQKE
jgi:large subunit ribosomal protein L6